MKGILYGKSEYSMLESAIKLSSYIKKAKDNNASFLALTDVNLSGAYKFYKACQKENIKPILGLEYSFIDIDLEKSKVLLYALNNEGYNELIKISTKIKTLKINSFEELKEYKNLAYIFVFNDSFLERTIKKDIELFNEAIFKYKSLNNSYIGISYTNRLDKIELNKLMEEKANELNINILPIHECLYLDYEDYSFNIIDDKRIDSFVEKINLDLYHDKIALPKYPNTKGYDSKEYLQALCFKGLEKRKKNLSNYIERLEYELSVINKMGYDDYFLIVWDFIKYAKTHDILVGPGRGSAAGSLVAYTLGITDVDPLEFGLLFERFLNPERVSMPDIDTDFPDIKREDVINYVKKVYGEDHICNISAFDTFQNNIALKDVAKVLNIEDERVKIISDMIKKYSFDELINYYYDDKKMIDYLTIVRKIKDMPRHTTTHAAGIILSAKPLIDIIPLQEGINGLYQAQFVAPDLEEIGLLKMDFLGISNLTLIDGVLKEINMPQKALRNIPLNDPKVYKMLKEADTIGIFQLESSGMRNYLKQLQCEKFDDIVAMIALYRPGPMDNIPDFIKRRHGEKFEYIHPDLAPILSSTYGVIVYQEQIMQIAQKFAGFSLGQADLLRRAISKKKVEALAKMENDFINSSINNGYSKDIAKKIYDLIYKFADYGFNKSHSVVYAYLAYQMLYLKANYFEAFMANILNGAISNKEKLEDLIDYSKSHGMTIYKPNVNVSTTQFVYDKVGLFMPLNSILSIGINVSNKIIEERQKGLFKSFDDFKERCPFVNDQALEALIFSGALDIFGLTKKNMLENKNSESTIFFKYLTDVKENNEEYDFNILKENEKKYLGMNLEYNILKDIDKLRIKAKAYPLSKAKLDSDIRSVVAIKELKKIKTKKNEDMIVGSLEDDTKTFRFVIFPKTLKELNFELKDGIIYLILAKFSKDNKNEDNLIINKIAPLNK
ncbi:MAG: DNA polymerase III subunit alpha [Acholeplasmatales bacterium]|nr:DNA polymerase III subunit alpha [Acholeplasmatales bacterium]